MSRTLVAVVLGGLGMLVGSACASDARPEGSTDGEGGRGEGGITSEGGASGEGGASDTGTAGSAESSAGTEAGSSSAGSGVGGAGSLDPPEGGSAGIARPSTGGSDNTAGSTAGGSGNSATGGNQNAGGNGTNTGGTTTVSEGSIYCASDLQCVDRGLLCDIDRELCVECISAADCGTDSVDCVRGTCASYIPCQNSLDCVDVGDALMICDADTLRCEECSQDADCVDDTFVCVNHQCVLSCDTDVTCVSEGLLCDLVSTGTCVQCLANSDCDATERCLDGGCVKNDCTPYNGACQAGNVVLCNGVGDGYAGQIDCDGAGCVDDADGIRCVGQPACGAGSVDLCQQLPRFVGEQNVDGSADEFCVPPMVFQLSELPYVNANTTVDVNAVVTARIGYSEEALHVHVHVTDDAIYPGSGSTLWNGDAVQIFIAGTDALTGDYSGTNDGGATHLVIAPPTSGEGGQAIEIYETLSGVSYSSYPSADYAARVVADGYEVEARIPWATSANPRQTGAIFGFNLMVNASVDGGFDLEAGLANDTEGLTLALPCEDRIHPGCDDRTWCRSSLQ